MILKITIWIHSLFMTTRLQLIITVRIWKQQNMKYERTSNLFRFLNDIIQCLRHLLLKKQKQDKLPEKKRKQPHPAPKEFWESDEIHQFRVNCTPYADFYKFKKWIETEVN